MSAVALAVSFAAGVYFSLRTIAALYRILDLWFAFGREWPRIARSVLGWGGTAALIALLLPYRTAFLWGLASYAAFFIVSYAIARILVEVHIRD